MHTRFRAFSGKTFWKIYPSTYSHWEKPNAPPKRENISEWKTSSLIWTKGAEMHTHFWGFLRKIFIRWKDLLTYSELQSQMTPYFTEKMRKCFFRLWVLYFCFPQKVSSLIPTENSQMHTLNLEKFLPFAYLELRGQNGPCFSEKIIWKDRLSQNTPLTCSHWQRTFGDVNLKKQ